MNEKEIIFSPPDITKSEIEAVAEVLRSGWITTGPKVKEFERRISKMCGTDRGEAHTAAALNSATASMEMVLRLFGIGDGDEVITTAYTYTATASAIYHVGARPVIVDVDRDSYEISYDAIANAITEKTKAIVAVDIGGVICDYDAIRKISIENKDIYKPSDNPYQQALRRCLVMADSAHGFGSIKDGKKSGKHADFTTFSFHAVKNLTTAEGGGVTWLELSGIDDEDIYKELMLLSLHGQSKDALTKDKLGSWEYDILFPGYKCNMTDVCAAIGLVQMDRYDELLDRRHQIVSMYDEGISLIEKNVGVKISTLSHTSAPSDKSQFRSSAHLYLMRIEGITHEIRCDIIDKMAKKGVPTNVHYKPLPLLSAYRNMGYDIIDYQNAYDMYVNEITLPLHTKLTDEDVEYILSCLRQTLEKISA